MATETAGEGGLGVSGNLELGSAEDRAGAMTRAGVRSPVRGRRFDAELRSPRDFVERVAGGAVALVLEGEAGMGKTTLWRAAVEHAEGLGLTVLRRTPP